MAKEPKAARPADERTPQTPPPDGGGGMNTGVAIIGFLLCFIAGAGLMWGYDKKHGTGPNGDIAADSSKGGGTWSDDDASPGVNSKDPMMGKRDAPVTIVIFSDYQCPFCSKVEPTLAQVKTTYANDVRFIWKNYPLPFHPNAKPAAEAAQGVFALAGNDAFWKFHDTAFSNQAQLGTDSYIKWAADAGVKDAAKFKAGLDAHTWAAKVETDMADAAKVKVTGTPALFINGVFLSGAQPFDKVKTVIDQELTKAKAKIASGTPKDKVYAAMSTENRKNVPSAPDAPSDSGDQEDTKTVFRVPVGASPVLGNANALVTIVEFSDFQCPFCSRVEPTLKTLRDKYGDKIRLVWKNEPLPMHPRAEPAAEFAMEAYAEKKSDGFYKAHDIMFNNQTKIADEDLWGYASQIGVNVDQVKSAMATHKYKASIDADNDLASDFKASGTPHFFVNGRRLVGAQPPEKFEKIIDEEIPKAQALIAKGTPPSQVYDVLTKDGKGPPPPEMKTLKDIPPNDPARGNMNAKVVIHEYSDFQCPFCGRVEPTVAEIMKNYSDKIKFVWHDMPLPMHADAPLASQAGREVYKQKGADAFWKFHDTLFNNQKEADALKRPALDGYAKAMGLDMDKWASALDTQSHKAEVDAAAKSGNDAGIQGTPAFVITSNGGTGYYISGAQPYSNFRSLIERALSEAK